MSDEDKETKGAGPDFHERGMVGTAMKTLGHKFTTKVAAIETYEEYCGKQHFCASTELFSSRYTRSRPLLCPLDPSRALCLVFLAFRVDESFFIELYLGDCTASRLQSTTAWCVFGSTIQPRHLNRRIRNRPLEAGSATHFRLSFQCIKEPPVMTSSAIMTYCIP